MNNINIWYVEVKKILDDLNLKVLFSLLHVESTSALFYILKVSCNIHYNSFQKPSQCAATISPNSKSITELHQPASISSKWQLMPLEIITVCCFCLPMACEVNKQGIKARGPCWTQSCYLTSNIQGGCFHPLHFTDVKWSLCLCLSPLPINRSVFSLRKRRLWKKLWIMALCKVRWFLFVHLFLINILAINILMSAFAPKWVLCIKL